MILIVGSDTTTTLPTLPLHRGNNNLWKVLYNVASYFLYVFFRSNSIPVYHRFQTFSYSSADGKSMRCPHFHFQEPEINNLTPRPAQWRSAETLAAIKTIITNVYLLHAFGNGAVAEGEKRINNDGLSIKLNINNIIKVSATANAIENNKWIVRWQSFT